MFRIVLGLLTSLLLLPTPAPAQTPTLVQSSDLVHQYSFTLPDTPDAAGQTCWDYANGTLAYNPANDSLFVVGHVWNQHVGEVSIPSGPGGRSRTRAAVRLR